MVAIILSCETWMMLKQARNALSEANTLWTLNAARPVAPIRALFDAASRWVRAFENVCSKRTINNTDVLILTNII